MNNTLIPKLGAGLIAGLAIATAVQAQEPQVPMPGMSMPGMTSAMQKSMDPQAYANMLQLLSSNPAIVSNPVTLCAQCHDEEAVERYQKTLLPAYQLMMNPAAWMNPNAYTQAMMPMMDPETYTEWYNAWMQMMNQMYAAPQADQQQQ